MVAEYESFMHNSSALSKSLLLENWREIESEIISFYTWYTFLIISGGVPVLLSPGIHSFPFKLGLPLGLPSTFLGKHGWVQYYCKTALKEAHTGLAHKNQQVFIVMNPIDLNQEPAILAVSKYFSQSFLVAFFVRDSKW